MVFMRWVHGFSVYDRSVSGFEGFYCIQMRQFFADTELRITNMFMCLSIYPWI